MIRLLAFEWKKIWNRKWWMIPAVFVGIILLWVIVTEGKTVAVALDGTAIRTNAETRFLWGQAVTEENKKIAWDRAVASGAKEESFEGYSYLSPSAVYEQYGGGFESDICTYWCSLAQEPTWEEDKTAWEESTAYTEQSHEFTVAYMRDLNRMKNSAQWQIAPTYCAWEFFLDMGGYCPLLCGIAALMLILILLSPVFSQEEGGGLREISLSMPHRTQWITAKILTAGLSGGLITFSLYGMLLLFFGFLLGFQGWNVSAVSYLAGGYVYGMMFGSVNALELACCRLLFLTLGGVFFGVLTAAASAIFRNAAAAAGTVLALSAAMENVYSRFIGYNVSMYFQPDIFYTKDWSMLGALCYTPVRLFLNPEILLAKVKPTDSFNMIPFYNSISYPDLALAFASTIILGILLCAALCYGYQRQR